MNYLTNEPSRQAAAAASTRTVGKSLPDRLLTTGVKSVPAEKEIPAVSPLPLLLAGLITGTIFCADIILHTRLPLPTFYVVPILVSLWASRQRHTLYITYGSTLLTVMGAYTMRPGSDLRLDITNRILTLGIIWVTAVICLLRKRAWEKLQASFTELEERVQQRAEDLTHMNEALEVEISDRKAAESALRKLSGRLLTLQDEERRRIARELHDTTAQSLAAIAVNLARIEKLQPNLDPKACDILADSLALAEQCSREIRTLSYLLHPPLLEEAGLAAALEWYATGFMQRSSIKVTLEAPADLGHLPSAVEMTLFRIVQESLTNISRHSGSPTANISLSRAANEVILLVKDQGRGIPQERLGKLSGNISGLGVGIAGIWERVRQYNGRMDIDSSSRGTRVKVVIPIPEYDEETQ